jgi:hypothetical protein
MHVGGSYNGIFVTCAVANKKLRRCGNSRAIDTPEPRKRTIGAPHGLVLDLVDRTTLSVDRASIRRRSVICVTPSYGVMV